MPITGDPAMSHQNDAVVIGPDPLDAFEGVFDPIFGTLRRSAKEAGEIERDGGRVEIAEQPEDADAVDAFDNP